MLAGIFYFTLGNLDPKYRSRYRSIQLLAICKKKTLDKYSLCSVLRPFVDDMKKLVSSFINVNAHHYPPLHTIRRRATHLVLKERAKYISAQLQLFHPASNSLGGFKETTAAYRYCRQCMVNSEEAKLKVSNSSRVNVLVYTCMQY